MHDYLELDVLTEKLKICSYSLFMWFSHFMTDVNVNFLKKSQTTCTSREAKYMGSNKGKYNGSIYYFEDWIPFVWVFAVAD